MVGRPDLQSPGSECLRDLVLYERRGADAPARGEACLNNTCRLERHLMRIVDPYVEELTSEASTTRRVLERVPEAHLKWRPHEKSMSLGQLAAHVATLPRQLTEFVTGDALDFS